MTGQDSLGTSAGATGSGSLAGADPPVSTAGSVTPVSPPKPQRPESFGGELDRAARKERHIAFRMLIALAIVALVVCARLLFFG
jgi:hypothetical protein